MILGKVIKRMGFVTMKTLRSHESTKIKELKAKAATYKEEIA